jgi:cyclomaltodextrinase / maltogenic alpha-amylase / neopullulanase
MPRQFLDNVFNLSPHSHPPAIESEPMRKLQFACFVLLCLATAAFGADKKPPLHELKAHSSPAWLTDGVMYQVYLRAFTPEGTLKAATAKLPRLAELGVSTVYVCPMFVADDDMDQKYWSPRQIKSQQNNPRNPYRMKDFYHVDPEYGTDADLKAFIAEAHRLKMHVMLDLVYFHCGPTAVFLKDHPDFVKRDQDGKFLVGEWKFPMHNFKNPELREYLWKNMEWFVRDFDADGYRCDVGDAVPLDFWEAGRERLEKIKPDVGMLSEGGRAKDQLKAFDLDYGWSPINWKNAAAMRTQWQAMFKERPQGGAKFIRFMDNHDYAHDCGKKRFEKSWGYEKVNAALVYLFTIDGVPFLYNGQEVADAAQHSIYARMPIDWANGGTPKGKERFAFCQKLCSLRNTEKALTHGDVIWLDNDQPKSALSFLRRSGDEQIVSVINLSKDPVKVQVTLPADVAASFAPLLSEKSSVAIDAGKASCELAGFGYFVGKGK